MKIKDLILIACLLLPTMAVAGIPDFPWMKSVGARCTPQNTQIFRVNNYGAKGDGEMLCTSSIQHAIDACSQSGGGTVTFAPGIYQTGSIYLKNNVTLCIPKGTMLIGSEKLSDYPLIETRAAGIEMKWPSAIINVIGQKNVMLTGDGVIHARGKVFWNKYREMRKEYDPKKLRWVVDYDCARPQSVLIQNSEDVTVKGLVFYQSGFWTIHILYSQYVSVDGVTIDNNIGGTGPSTDGIDIDSSSKVLVENSYVNCNDDNFCLKSGRDADGLRVNIPCEYVVIRNCKAGHGDGLFTCGSETSGGIRHVVAYNLEGDSTKYGLRFKSTITRGGTIEDITISHVVMKNMKIPIVVDLNWLPTYNQNKLPDGYTMSNIPAHWKKLLQQVAPEQGMPKFKNITFSDITATGCLQCIKVEGIKASTIDGFKLDNVHLEGKDSGSIKYANDWDVTNCSIKTQNASKVKITNTKNINWQE